ncbi:MAG: hypothetical protein AB1480_12060 [Nitrospirota bacterium]
MGIYHFSPVGINPGAVTCALAYLKQNKDSFIARGDVIESIILFASSDVREGSTKTRECIYNDYMSMTARKTLKMVNILNVITEFIISEIADIMPKKGTVYCCVVDPNDYDSCFEVIAKAALHFSPPGDTGKNIWANLTGGTNVLNASLLQVAFLSGLISRIYYTFLPREDDRKYLQPVKNDSERFRWDEVPFIKTSFDNVYQALLQELKDLSEEWCLDENLLGCLRQASWKYLRPEDLKTINTMDIQIFRQEWLNKLDGRELERQVLPDGSLGRYIRLSGAGKRLLGRIESPLFQALVQRGKGITVENTTDLIQGLEIEELWSKP